MQPESALFRQGAQQQLDGGRNVATDIAEREGPDGVPVGVGHGQLVRVQPAAHVGDSVYAAHSAHHQYGGKSHFAPKEYLWALVQLEVRRQCQHQQHRSGSGGGYQDGGVHIAGRVSHGIQISSQPEAERQHQRSRMDAAAAGKFFTQEFDGWVPVVGQVFRRDQQAEQDDRQVDGLAGGGQTAQHDEQDLLPPDSFLAPQAQAKRREAEHQPQHGGIRGKAGRQLQRHGQQRHAGKQPAQAGRGQPNGQRRQQ